MPPSIEATTTAALSAALDTSALRHAAIAANIANVHTEHYVPLRVTFDGRMEDAREALRERGTLDAAAVSAIRGEIQPLLDAGGTAGRVQLDVEMTELARNSAQFQALTQALSRHLSTLALAAADGRK